MTVPITYRTLGTWGPGVGRNLQPAEVDNNYWQLAQAIVDLQTNPAEANGIANITVSGVQMTITLMDGTVLGPYTLPVLMFRWRYEWQPLTTYADLDVFTVTNVGIFCVIIAHTSGDAFDPNITVDVGGVPAAALNMLFGSADASLSALSDVKVTDIQDNDVLVWNATDLLWENETLGTMAFQAANAVAISGGTITGMPGPAAASDVATKGYVDGAVSGGASIADKTILANIAGTTAPAHANTLSDILDHDLATTVRGTLLYRSGSGWIALSPGTSGQFLSTRGSGADPVWAVGGAGITSIAAGAGISTGGAPITATGTVSFDTIAAGNLLANISGVTAVPTPNTLTAILDALVGNIRGAVAYRGATVWTSLPPDSAGKYLKTQGPGIDPMWDNPSGSGTVTSVGTGTGLTGGPITSTGTLALAPVADGTLLGNISGASAAPLPATLTQYLDHVFASSAQGSVIYRGASAYAALGPGTTGQVLTTGGTTANPTWSSGAGAPAISDHFVLANLSGATGAATGHSLSDILDYDIGSSRGQFLYRGASGWLALAPGTAGQVLTTGGTSADPAWAAGGGGASITIGDTAPATPAVGALWWDSVGGQLYLWFDDGSSRQWVPATNQPGPVGATGAAGPTGPAGTYQSGPGLVINSGTTPPTIDVATPYLALSGGTLSGALRVSPQATQLGGASGSSSAPTNANTNLLLYSVNSTNWSGIGSGTGGEMYFVTGTSGTPSTRMIIDTGGNVGIGTTAPGARLHVETTDASGGTTRVAGFQQVVGTPTVDIVTIGGFAGSGNNLLNIEDSNGGTLGSGTSRFVVKAGGNVGIGTSTPNGPLHVRFQAAAGGSATSIASGPNGSDGTTWMMQFMDYGGAVVIGTIARAGTNNVSYNTTSDLRLKDNIVESKRGLDALMAIKVSDYKMGKTAQQGLLAQDVAKVYPEAVHEGGKDPNLQPWMIDYGRLTPLLIKSLQQQQEMIKALSAKVDALNVPSKAR